jgi:hypothetical protein
MTQDKVERYHRSMKNQILLENYYLPGQFEQRLAEFVDYYNLRRYHESLNKPNPGRCLLRSWSNHPDTEGKHQAENHRVTTPAASCTRSHNFNSDGPDPLLSLLLTCPKGSDVVHSTPSGIRAIGVRREAHLLAKGDAGTARARSVGSDQRWPCWYF